MKRLSRKSERAVHRSRRASWAAAVAGICGLVLASGQAQVEVNMASTTGSLDKAEVNPAAAGAAGRQPSDVRTTTTGRAQAAAADSPEAAAAIEAANKLVAPRQEVVGQEEETTVPQSATSSGPVTMEGRELVARTDGSTESRAVASGAELIRMLNLVARKPAGGGREIDDQRNGNGLNGAVNLFPNEDEVRKLLGENPTVVYRVVVNGTPLPDPMIIPWIRQGRVVEELFDEAVDLLAQGKVDNARERLMALMTEYPATEQAEKAKEILHKLEGIQATPTPRPAGKIATPTPSPTPLEVQLNPNVKVSTVLIDPANPSDNRVVIGGRSYALGEKLRNYPDHKIVSISDDTVIIEVEKQGVTKQFPIPVRPAGSNQ